MNALPNCERCETPLEAGDLRCAICGHTAPDTGARQETTSIQVLRCGSCGAAVSYDAHVGAPNCSFCDSVMRLEEISDPVEQTEAFVPFRVSREQARARLKSWLGSQGFFRPPDLATRARLESLKALYWVAWSCDARAFVTWAADSNEGSRRSAWAPHSGEAHMEFDDLLVSASRGLTNKEVIALAPYYPLHSTNESPTGLEQIEEVAIEAFDVQRSQARRRIISAIHRTAAARVEVRHIPGKRFRNVHASALLEGLDTRRLAIPAWVFAYRYKGKLYRAVVSGEEVEGITGTVPFSWARLAMVIFAALAVLLIVLTAITL